MDNGQAGEGQKAKPIVRKGTACEEAGTGLAGLGQKGSGTAPALTIDH
jgi:hypothetical protein